MDENKNTQLFLSLIYSFQMQAMMQLGKLKNPLTDKTEKELEAAQVTIEMLDMLKEKTKGNISDDESKFLEQVISDLKLNYIEEKNKPAEEPGSSPASESSAGDLTGQAGKEEESKKENS